MEHRSLTYVERLMNLHVLMETKQMLQTKLAEMNGDDQSFELVKEDLRKIEEEIKSYADEQSIEALDQSMPHALFNPAVTEELDTQ
ncbi:hypothetical protein P4637_05670 [Halalkalibacterium halodurans]|jgi:ATP/maltotriose-dependent transcriptional regulator MalT|uniref:BH3087 protein n=2 Tax=Halalkalibacterium halodurans TaxID=86665 RepID=Q9K8B9_HALH5|nr:hypothetical protein [Halalkalibacterium halodurans]MED4082070.1 hypothetical protein [Halalkalibacterium halodurans]MED4084352.1 hypothetical protein [Halalkalibacterium halodurans]MED4103661.1 hypothetical protein [Halalkalibacterium halodurans]MED4107628.1 hypothetical protein [Halalkalibacterium halodurans]MED4126249.1 hypothetical protein [Halalkalibacterium halodurans]